MKHRLASVLLVLSLLLPIFSFADLVDPPLSPESREFPFIIGGVALIGIIIFVIIMRRRKNKK